MKSRTATERFAAAFEQFEASDEYLVGITKLRVAELLGEQMERLGLSARQLADRLGKSPAYISKLRAGEQNLTIESLVRLAHVLECSLELKFRPRTDLTQTIAPTLDAETLPATGTAFESGR